MMPAPTFVEVNQAIRGLTVLQRLDVLSNDNCSSYDLLLELSDKPKHPNIRTSVLFSGVSALRLKDIGGGLTQLLFLNVTAVENSGVEGIAFEVSELERNSISFKCESIQLSKNRAPESTS